MSEEVPDDVKEEVESLCDDNGIDIDRGRNEFMDVVEEIRDYDSGLSDERVFSTALQTFKADIISELSDGSEDVNFVAYGHRGFRQQPYRNDDGEMVDSDGNPTDDWQEAAKRDVLDVIGVAPVEGAGWVPVSVTFDSDDDVDIDHAANVCTFGTGVETRLYMTELDELKGHYRAYSSATTEVEEGYSEVPEDQEERVEKLQEAADSASIADISDALSASERSDNGRDYLVANGVDVKVFNGSIVDYYKDDVDGTYIYTIMDESVMPEDVEGSDIDSDSARTPGLTCWTNAQVMQFDTGTTGEFYGSVSRNNDDGRITMQLLGIDPIFPRELEDGDSEEGGENVESMSL